MIRFGYACINDELRSSKVPIYTGRSCTRRTFNDKGLPHVSRLIEANTRDLIKIVRWNIDHGIHVFRISSSMCSWASEYELDELPDYAAIVRNLNIAGRLARAGDLRLSFHPGQFNVLSSARQSVVDNSIKDLELHGKLMDLLDQPRSHEAKINIHIGGRRDISAVHRFADAFKQLSAAVSSRLTVENDDKANCYAVTDLIEVNKLTGVPIVFDYHHHKFCSGDLDEADALGLAATTWSAGIRQVVHYAESRDELRLTPAHSDWIEGPINAHGRELDCVLECKMKERALLRLRAAQT